MSWFNKIVNKNDVPKDLIYVAIQNGKADYYREVSHFIKIDRVLAFPTKEIAEYFISNYTKEISDFREVLPKEDFTFWVFDKCDYEKYYADDINMRVDYTPLWSTN